MTLSDDDIARLAHEAEAGYDLDQLVVRDRDGTCAYAALSSVEIGLTYEVRGVPAMPTIRQSMYTPNQVKVVHHATGIAVTVSGNRHDDGLFAATDFVADSKGIFRRHRIYGDPPAWLLALVRRSRTRAESLLEAPPFSL